MDKAVATNNAAIVRHCHPALVATVDGVVIRHCPPALVSHLCCLPPLNLAASHCSCCWQSIALTASASTLLPLGHPVIVAGAPPLCGVIQNLEEQYVAQPRNPPPLGQRNNVQSSSVPPLSGPKPMLMPMLVLSLTTPHQQSPLPLLQLRASTALVG